MFLGVNLLTLNGVKYLCKCVGEWRLKLRFKNLSPDLFACEFDGRTDVRTYVRMYEYMYVYMYVCVTVGNKIKTCYFRLIIIVKQVILITPVLGGIHRHQNMKDKVRVSVLKLSAR